MNVEITLTANEKVDLCPICSTPEIEKMTTCKLSYCSQCQFYFLDPRPGQNEILASYNTGITFSTWQNELSKRKLLWKKRLKLIRRYKKSGRLFDLGTGDGFFLEFASNYFDIDSLEISDAGIQRAVKRGYQPFHGSIDDLEVDQMQKYDVITLWHVLEHLPNPADALNKIYSLLKPDGILVVAVPNETFSLMRSKVIKAVNGRQANWPILYWGGEIHLNYFTPKSLKLFLCKFGFLIRDFLVDDVHVSKTAFSICTFYLNCMLNSLFAWHMDKAMAVIAEKGNGTGILRQFS